LLGKAESVKVTLSTLFSFIGVPSVMDYLSVSLQTNQYQALKGDDILVTSVTLKSGFTYKF
jgi:hypothetical protein